MIINHFLFADDAVVFAPSAKGLKKLLDACSKFAVTLNVIFNVNKSQCLIVQSAPCGFRGCKNGPATFLGRISYKATKQGLVFVLYLSMFLLC